MLLESLTDILCEILVSSIVTNISGLDIGSRKHGVCGFMVVERDPLGFHSY